MASNKQDNFFDKIRMFDVILSSEFLQKHGKRLRKEFLEFGKRTPIVYMNDLLSTFRKRARTEVDINTYIDIFVGKTGQLEQIEKLTIFYHINVYECNLASSDFVKLIDEMIQRFSRVKIESGTMVGVIAAQSLSEKLQQATLNSFHSTGNKKAAHVGLKRLTEVLDATKTPTCVCLYGIQVPDTSMLLEKTFRTYCKDFVIKNGTIEFQMTESFRYNSTTFKQVFQKFLAYDNKTLIYQNNKIQKEPMLKSIAWSILKTPWSGIKNVIEVEDDDMYFSERTGPKSHDTLLDIVNVYPEVDFTKFYSNDYRFIADTLGIEATRAYLLDELSSVLRNEGIEVSQRHLNLIVEHMCVGGEVNANRYSSLELDESAILKSTFQQATTTFAEAASKNTTDYLKDASSQILLGKAPKIGISCCHLVEPVCEKEQIKCVEPEEIEVIDSPKYIEHDSDIESPKYYDSDSSAFEVETEMLDMQLKI